MGGLEYLKLYTNQLKIRVLVVINKFRQLFLMLCVGLVQILNVSKNSHWKFCHAGSDSSSVNLY